MGITGRIFYIGVKFPFTSKMGESPAFYRLEQEHAETLKRLKKVEDENESLLKLNELFREELGQKTLALQKSADAYSQLKKQYEELLTRVTELQFEKRPLREGARSPEVASGLRSQVQALMKRKGEYKELVVEMKERILELEEEKKRTRRSIDRFLEIAGPYATGDGVVEVGRGLVAVIENSVAREKYDALKRKYRAAMRKCEQMSRLVQGNQEMIEKEIASNQARQRVGSIEDELAKFQRFVLRYEEKSRRLHAHERS